jgi:hypothetical protein
MARFERLRLHLAGQTLLFFAPRTRTDSDLGRAFLPFWTALKATGSKRWWSGTQADLPVILSLKSLECSC